MLVWEVGTGPHVPCLESLQVCLRCLDFKLAVVMWPGIATTQCASVVGAAHSLLLRA